MKFHSIKYTALVLTLSTNFAVSAAPLDITQTPNFLATSTAPLTMLVMGRNHKLYYEAYNDRSDLDGDGVLDIRYNPNIDYYGYFDSYKCYNYSNSKKRFNPSSITSNKQCNGSTWSGDFLNYLTTSRIDAVRKVLYGGYRTIDSRNTTVLARSPIPQDAHSWGKEYNSVAVDGYNINNYTPLSPPSNGNYHLFASTTLQNGNGDPILRYITNKPYRIWEWLSIERPIADKYVNTGSKNINVSSYIKDLVVHVKVCDPSVGLESNCTLYPNNRYKPTGLLQDFGENGSMKFGLITGSYEKNLSGGVLRKNIANISDEINASTGQFTNTVGIIKTIDRLKTVGFGNDYQYNDNCGWITTRNITNGECSMWGNPIAEMMYEGLRYFAGKMTPTSAFYTTGGQDASLGLPVASWQNPFDSSNNPYCAKANMLVISDINPSDDSDEVPGSYFNSFSGDLSPSLNATSLGQTIWDTEQGNSSTYFIGQSSNNNDGAPTEKMVTSFGNIRGLSPEEPNREGSYYSSSVAYYGWLNDLNSATGTQKVSTFAVALASPMPEIKINVNGNTVKLIPFAKSVGGCFGVQSTQGLFQPTNQIVDFYVESLNENSGTFRINFEDVQQGADHDMDAVTRYSYTLNNDNTITVTVSSEYAAGCIQQHMGYVISGTTADGVYLEVRDLDTPANEDTDYFLDTPPGQNPGGIWTDGTALPTTTSRTFSPSGTSATILKDPLWYAAKWGNFEDKNGNNIPDQASEFDTDSNGVPDNYFLVTNPLKLKQQLTSAFNNIMSQSGSLSSAILNSASLNNETRIFTSNYNTDSWSGKLYSYTLSTNPTSNEGNINLAGSGPNGSSWEASDLLQSKNYDTQRQVITYKPSLKRGIAFRWPNNPNSPSSNELDTTQSNMLSLNPTNGINDNQGSQRVNYLRGDRSNEIKNNGIFRNRTSLLGDIMFSSALYLDTPQFPYPDSWPSGAAENSSNYNAFKIAHANRSKLLMVGANDGFLHGFDAESGDEIFAYLPSPLISKLNKLTAPNYTHNYYVDGSPNSADVFFNNSWKTVVIGGLNAGGQGIYALDITKPNLIKENNAQNVVLWEFTDADDADLGLTYSRPAIVRMANGKWAAVFGNGYNNTLNDGKVSTTGNGVLYIVDIATGNLLKKLDTKVGMNEDPLNLARPNGLASPAAVDTNGDYIADYIYVGDLFGNLWKIDVRSNDPSNWNFSFLDNNNPEPLFVAKDANSKAQAITTRPNIKRLNYSTQGMQIVFGTGKNLETTDNSSDDVQTLYSIYDEHNRVISSRSDLLQQTILATESINVNGTTNSYRITSNHQPNKSYKGWYLDLIENNNKLGERIINDPIIRNSKVIVSTMIPSTDVCANQGTGWLLELDLYSGSRLNETPFDTNGDGTFTTEDKISYNNGKTTTQVVASGVKSTVGLISSPAILTKDDKEYKYLTGTDGSIQKILENPGSFKPGRRSWRQLR